MAHRRLKFTASFVSLFQNNQLLQISVVYPICKKLFLPDIPRNQTTGTIQEKSDHGHKQFSDFFPVFHFACAYCQDEKQSNLRKSMFKRKYLSSKDIGACDKSCQKLLRLVKARQLYSVKTHLQTNQLSSNNINKCKHSYGWTPLMVSAVSGNTELLKVLLEAGANPNALDDYFSTTTSKKGMKNRKKYIVRKREFSDLLDPAMDFRGYTALHYAVLQGSEKTVKLLIEKGADPSIRSFSGHIPEELVNSEQTSLLQLIKSYKEKTVSEDQQKNVSEDQQKTVYVDQEKEAQERILLPLEEKLRESIIGQDNAILTVAAAIRRKQNGWINDKHPLVFLFLGPSGTGKTELTKQLACYLHKSNKNGLIRFDMSEYQEKHEVAKLIGAPPGYKGHHEGGQLTAKLRMQPDSVVLFDEVDKAHPDVLTLLLQLFDEGRLTDCKGQTSECKDAVFIMTSNLAASDIADYGQKIKKHQNHNVDLVNEKSNSKEEVVGVAKVTRTFQEAVVRPILRRHLGRDEFLGRINEFVYFLPFSYSEILQLVKKELKMWKNHAKSKHNVNFSWQDPEVTALLARGYNVHYGGRSLRYEVDRRVITLLAHAQELGFLTQGCSVNIKVVEGETVDSSQLQLDITAVKKENKLCLNESQLLNWQLKSIPNLA